MNNWKAKVKAAFALTFWQNENLKLAFGNFRFLWAPALIDCVFSGEKRQCLLMLCLLMAFFAIIF